MFARFFKRFQRPQVPVMDERNEIADTVLRLSEKLQSYLIEEIQTLGFEDVDLAYAAQLTFSDENIKKEMAALPIRRNTAEQVYGYLLASKNLGEVIARTKSEPMTTARLPHFVQELHDIRCFVLEVHLTQPSRIIKRSALLPGLRESRQEIERFRRQVAIQVYEHYIQQRRLQNQKENRVLRFIRNKFSEFDSDKKISAAHEMIDVLRRPHSANLTDAAINALVNGKLSLFTKKYANQELLREVQKRYNPETHAFEISGLEVVPWEGSIKNKKAGRSQSFMQA